jgi:hypothetical protein
MVSTVAFFGKSIEPFQKWTKKMSKIENQKHFMTQKIMKILQFILFIEKYT